MSSGHGFCSALPFTGGAILAPTAEKLLLQEVHQAGIVLRPRRQLHDPSETVGIPAEVTGLPLADDLYHPAHDRVLDIAIRPGVDPDQLARRCPAVIFPTAEQEFRLAHALVGDLEDAAAGARAPC